VEFVHQGDGFDYVIDVLLDNMMTDILFHERIKESKQNLEMMIEELRPQVEKWEEMVEDSKIVREEKQQILEGSRARLLDSRIAFFGGFVGDVLPKYDA
jgi:hypothetical protein